MIGAQPEVAVIGGGCAGLAAAAQLTEHDIPVTLFEASPYLGGRARGVPWKGLCLDNGQHILLGAYSETLRMLQLTGADIDTDFLRIPLRLHMHGELKLSTTPGLPAPLHILFGFLFAHGLSVKERLAAIRLMTWLKSQSFNLPLDQTLSTLLEQKQQPDRLVRLMWEPLCLAALNTPVSQASAQVFANVLRDSFAARKADSDMLLPKRDLSSVLANPLADYISRKGGKIQLGARVTKLNKSRKFEIETEDGDQQLFTHVVLATSPFRLPPLLAGFPQLTNISELVSQLDYQPIYTVYLQYPDDVRLQQPMIGFAATDNPGIYSQWLFDRGWLCNQPGLLAVVISAEGPHQKLTQEALAQAVAEELSQAFPNMREPVWHKVIAEKRATFACRPDMPRPLQQTAVSGLYLAGDFTSDGTTAKLYPATIEGAVRSGVQCANHILADSRREQ